jgi:hypothetical protein
MPRSYGRKAIRPEMTVRQVAADFPSSEEVFRRHGEADAPPARFGHLEPLAHFARRRGMSLEALLAELAAATGAPVERRKRFAGRIHHGFIVAALVLTLTLGAGWGAILLWQISSRRTFDDMPAAAVVAHGEAQLWGFVALFIIGISLRTVLQDAIAFRFGPQLCHGLLGLALAGIGGGFLWSLFPARLAPLGVISALALGLMSLGLWALQVALLRAKWRTTWARAVMISGFWLTLWAVVTLGFRWNVGAGGPSAYNETQRLLLIELAVFGFAMNSIYGFGQMLLPGLLRLGKVRAWAMNLSQALHNGGAVLTCAATASQRHGWLVGLGCLLLLAGAVFFAIANRGFIGRRHAAARDEQGEASLDSYPPLAFFWLLASLGLMAGGILYESSAGRPLPHAYMGAVRHALTVGFMTTLILGVGQRLLPVLDRTVLAMPRLAVPILVLIGLGNLLRVTTELASMTTESVFPVMPFSAVLEWLALLLFAVNAMATMFHRDPLITRGRVTRRSSLAELLARHPAIEDRLRPRGTRYLERTRSVPDELTIGSFAASEGSDPDELVASINGWLTEGLPAR